MSANVKYIVGGILFILIFSIGSFFAIKEAANYDKEHPIVCDKKGTIKEILAIEKNYATIKLENEEIVKYKIVELYNRSAVYNDIKPQDTICLSYSRK